ncbi:MAG: manganese efflux pump MntP family protein [Eubacteriales bacterium]|nr:manganese efflux pump MntP family protein [Eubacteriales bacterium]
MGIWELLILAIGLSMDAFAVSVCKGLSMEKISLKSAGVVGAWFGGFQALMPLMGYLLGSQFSSYIDKIDHWIAFALLALIGLNMIREAFSKEENEAMASSISFRAMLAPAIATSIDALAVGVTFAFLDVAVVPAVCCIGIITCVLSMVGVKVGSVFGTRYKSKAEFVGGAILVLLGVKILLSHLGIL